MAGCVPAYRVRATKFHQHPAQIREEVRQRVVYGRNLFVSWHAIKGRLYGDPQTAYTLHDCMARPSLIKVNVSYPASSTVSRSI